jgi:predicted dehydrogenase
VTTSDVSLGLIGAGNWGKNYISTILKNPNATLGWLVSRKKDSYDYVGSSCNIISNWTDLLEEDELDGVIVAIPPGFQGEIALKAINKGIPILLEKPLALSIETVDLIKSSCENKKAKVMVDYTYLYHPAYVKLLDIIGTVGLIREISSIGGNFGPFRETCSVLWDWAPHDIAMCIKLMNEQPKVLGATREIVDFKTHQGEIIKVTLLFPKNKVSASLIFGNGMKDKKRRFQVTGDRGNLFFDDLISHKLTFIGSNMGNKEIFIKNKLPLDSVIDEFINMIKKDKKRCFDVDFSRSITRVILDIESFL